MNGIFVIRWIVSYFWDNAINTLKVTLAVTLCMVVFTFLNKAGCMISSLDIEDKTEELVNYILAIIDFVLIGISLSHTCTALIQGAKGQGRGK